MEDNEITPANTCADLLSLRKNEGFPSTLLLAKRPGEWASVREICQQIGVPPGELGADVYAAWLPEPQGEGAYAVVLFYDVESQWSMTAYYNRARLVASSKQSLPLHDAVSPPSATLLGQVNPVPEASR